MATKAAKSITINATKYQLANTLAVSDGKMQLKADDVVLSEVDAPSGSEAIFVYNHYDSDEGYYVTDAIKDIEGNVLTNAQVCKKVKAGAQIYVQVVAASGSNNGKFQLLDKYVHEEYSGGSVVQEHFWSEGNSFGKYVGMTFRLDTNWVSAPNISDNKGEFVITMTEEGDFFSDGSKPCESFACQDLIDAITEGKSVYIVVPKNIDSNDNYTDYAVVPVVAYYSGANATTWLSFSRGTDMYEAMLPGYPTTVSAITITKNPSKVVVEARLTSDMSLNQVGGGAGWRGMSFPAVSFSDIVTMLTNRKTVYIALKGSTNELTAFAPLSLTRRFAADMWSSQLTFVADGSVFSINDTPEIKRG